MADRGWKSEVRHGQTLLYDEQNRLKQWSSGGTNVFFGYAHNGERL